MPPYVYDSGNHREKHHWDKPYAGFQPDTKRGAVGKCNNTITQEIAQELLDDAVPGLVDDNGHPTEYYAVYEGDVYVAVSTLTGQSYHGYPWRGDINENHKIPTNIRNELAERASQAGFSKEFDKWMKKYGPKK